MIENHGVGHRVWFLIIAVAMATALMPRLGLGQAPPEAPPTGYFEEEETATALEASPDYPTYLYFADEKCEFLTGEARRRVSCENPTACCRMLLEGLIKGPSKSGLVRTLPEGTGLRAVYIGPDETIYVDFTEKIRAGHPGGVRSEMMTVYSIVNTLVLNVSGVEQVKILIEGQEAETLAGHVDIRFPLKADMLLIR